MQPVLLVLVYAVLMSFWWVGMKLLMQMESKGVLFPNNLIRLASGLGAGLLIPYSLVRNGGWSYVQKIPVEYWGWLTVTVMLNVGIAYCWIKAMQKSVASIAVHVTLLSPVVAIGTASLLGTDKWPSFLGFLGIVSVLFGLYVLHYDPRQYGMRLIGPWQEIWQKRGEWLWYALTVALLAGFSIPIDKTCVILTDCAFAPGMTLFLAWGLFFGVLAWSSGDYQSVRQFRLVPVLLGLVIVGICFGVANAFAAEAYRFQHAAVVASLKRLDAPFTVLWAFVFLSREERQHGYFPCRIIGSSVAFLGALLIGLD